MCLPLVYIVLQVLFIQSATSYPYKDYILAYIPVEEMAYLLPENIQAMPVPYYNSALFFDTWYFQVMMMQNARFPYRQTTGLASFGGQVRANGGVTSTGTFGNQGFSTFTSYSAPPTPLVVTPQPSLPRTSNLLTDTMLPTSTNLPAITTLPAVTLPSTTVKLPSIDNMPSTVTVPIMPMPFIMATTTVPFDGDLNGNVASPIKFSGLVPASGRVRISKHFC